jgi:hypothetical protein
MKKGRRGSHEARQVQGYLHFLEEWGTKGVVQQDGPTLGADRSALLRQDVGLRDANASLLVVARRCLSLLL